MNKTIEAYIWILLIVIIIFACIMLKLNSPDNNKLKSKMKNYISKYKWYICLSIITTYIFFIIFYWLLIIPFPKARGISRDTWVTFWGSIIGCTIGGIVGGIIAYKIMKYQIEKDNEKMDDDRKQRIKLDLQIETSKQTLLAINSIKNKLIQIHSKFSVTLSFTSHYYQLESNSMEQILLEICNEKKDFHKKIQELENIILNRRIILGNTLYEKCYAIVSSLYEIYTFDLNLQLDIEKIFSYIRHNEFQAKCNTPSEQEINEQKTFIGKQGEQIILSYNSNKIPLLKKTYSDMLYLEIEIQNSFLGNIMKNNLNLSEIEIRKENFEDIKSKDVM